jgi:hypothetical protein
MRESAAFDNSPWDKKAGSNFINAASREMITDLNDYGKSLLGKTSIPFLDNQFVQAHCYYPGGNIASDQKACDPGASTSLCCPAGWVCFSNNLCVVTVQSAAEGNFPLGTALRGTCTSTSWDNSICGAFCLGTCLC